MSIAPDDSERPLPAGWMPIREVARVTGVNPVTLRAWERRYGLVVPYRTAKGHRLFDAGHVQRIQQILTWLNRGVAVSQVKALLDPANPVAPQTLANDWQLLRERLVESIGELAERRVDELFNQAMSLYPPLTLCEQLILPLLTELEHRWHGRFGGHLERVFFHTWLRSKLGARIYHNNRRLSGQPVLLVNQSDVALEPYLWITAWLVSSADCLVDVFDASVPIGELALATERLGARALVLYAGKALNLGQLPRLLGPCHCAKLIVGPAVLIHREQWPGLQALITELSLADSPLSAHAQLLRGGLLQALTL